MESHDVRAMGHLRSIKIKKLTCSFSHSKNEAACCAQRHNRPSIQARGIRAGYPQRSHSYAASTRSADPGTSLFPLSFLSHLLILG